MNELLFVLHTITIIGLIFLALRIGQKTLVALFATQMIFANLFVTKQMECFSLTVTCSDVYTIGALLTLNLLQEYFGRSVARQAVWTSALTLIGFVVMGWIHLSYAPSKIDIGQQALQEAFQKILGQTPRIIFASLIVSFLSDQLDMKLYAYAKKKWKACSLATRFSLTALCTQLFDTVAFSFAGLYGIAYSITSIICLSYLIKALIIFTMAPLTTLAKKWARPLEQTL